MKIFLDTNILVDLIADRKPFSKQAIEIFSSAEKNKTQLFTSSHSVATTHYLLKKYVDEKELREIICNLLEFLTVISVDVDILKKGLRSNHRDFEDAIQIFCATTVSGLNFIVTRNSKDFKTSEIPVLTPDEMCLKLNSF
ncbi:PIN domain-containing protein [Flavobacterium sp.]|uniref:type II toxin-antitoxin system VapC family toxin n=1 Tax=Flavobacterium sp. TaxID=239 RepID=UPI0026230A81|nr:PIN domain-containing protein [Flavobacterium sp.]